MNPRFLFRILPVLFLLFCRIGGTADAGAGAAARPSGMRAAAVLPYFPQDELAGDPVFGSRGEMRHHNYAELCSESESESELLERTTSRRGNGEKCLDLPAGRLPDFLEILRSSHGSDPRLNLPPEPCSEFRFGRAPPVRRG